VLMMFQSWLAGRRWGQSGLFGREKWDRGTRESGQSVQISDSYLHDLHAKSPSTSVQENGQPLALHVTLNTLHNDLTFILSQQPGSLLGSVTATGGGVGTGKTVVKPVGSSPAISTTSIKLASYSRAKEKSHTV
jgi:hypothetical protein